MRSPGIWLLTKTLGPLLAMAVFLGAAGAIAQNIGAPTVSIEALRALAEQGNAVAQNNLGLR